MARVLLLLLAGLVATSVAMGARAETAARPQEPELEPATLVCLGVRWPVQGDDNANAVVRVSYRRAGERDWRDALPLVRVRGESRKERLLVAETLHAGSVFDLLPNTAYELRLRLADPDGGNAERRLRARTRGEPRAAKNAPLRHVVPGSGGGTGTAKDPFRGLDAAQAAARPGDLFLLRRGVYAGAFTVARSGEPGRPIVWRGAPGVILDGGGAERIISATGVHDIFFENLAIRNGRWGIVAHEASRLVVRGCRFTKITAGFTATRNQPVMRDLFIADNVLEGPATWPRTKGIEESEGIQVSGEGHVVCHNRIRGFADAVSVFSNTPNRAIDIYNNEISECTDDGIELDYGETNVRAFRNRLTNCFQGISTQPIYGGPAYILRNALYNLEMETFKLHNRPAGVIAYHNTSVKAGMPLVLWTNEPVYNVVFRNNLFLGGAASNAFETTAPMIDCDFDYDGFGGGPFTGDFVRWNRQRFPTIDALRASGALERHAVLVDPATAFASGARPPSDFKKQLPVARNDLRLRRGTAAIDAGQRLPNINDGFTGRAPDLGAYELGQPLPRYGPRSGRR